MCAALFHQGGKSHYVMWSRSHRYGFALLIKPGFLRDGQSLPINVLRAQLAALWVCGGKRLVDIGSIRRKGFWPAQWKISRSKYRSYKAAFFGQTFPPSPLSMSIRRPISALPLQARTSNTRIFYSLKRFEPPVYYQGDPIISEQDCRRKERSGRAVHSTGLTCAPV
jgi:hypothetical protein